MAKSTVRNIELDPRFYIPTGVVDLRQSNKENSDYVYDETVQAVDGPILATPESTIPMPPTSYAIYQQRVRIASDGRAVVDVIVEFPEVDGVSDIKVRVNPA